MPYIFSFRPFLAKNEVEYYPISILRPDSESSHQGASIRHQNGKDYKTLFFDYPLQFEIFGYQGQGGDNNFREMKHANLFPEVQSMIKPWEHLAPW